MNKNTPVTPNDKWFRGHCLRYLLCCVCCFSISWFLTTCALNNCAVIVAVLPVSGLALYLYTAKTLTPKQGGIMLTMLAAYFIGIIVFFVHVLENAAPSHLNIVTETFLIFLTGIVTFVTLRAIGLFPLQTDKDFAG